MGNTVLVVEHDEEIMMAADEIIDIGPLAGKNGETLLQETQYIGNHSESLTAKYLTNVERIHSHRRKVNYSVSINGARKQPKKYFVNISSECDGSFRCKWLR